MPKPHKMTSLNRVYGYLECLLQRQGQNANSCDWIELEHTPDVDLLAKASAYVAHRHPAIQAASTFGGLKGWTWVRNLDALPEIQYVEIDEPAPKNPDERLSHNIWGKPLDHENGPPWRLHVTVYRDKCIVQSITSHIYTCGKSANIITGDLLRAYDTLARGDVLDTNVVDVLDRNTNALFTPNWTRSQRFMSWCRTMAQMTGELIWRPVGLATNKKWAVNRGKTRVAFVDIGSDLWHHLRGFAREEEISRHPFYLAAWSEALLEFNESQGATYKGPLKIMDNFSLRPFSDQNLDQFYDLCAPPYAISVPYAKSDKQGRREIYDTVSTLKEGKILDEIARYNFYHHAVNILGKYFGPSAVIATVAKSPFILSNTGPIAKEILAPNALNVQRYYSFPQLFQPGKIMLILTTTPDDLRAIFLWDENSISEDLMVNDLIPRFRKALARSTNLHDFGVPEMAAAE